MTTPLVNRVRELRQARPGMTQESLAELCGVTRQTIIALESGRYSPSLELAFRLSRAFGVGVEDVFRWQPSGQRAGAQKLNGFRRK